MKNVHYVDANGLILPFRFNEICIISKLETAIYLLSRQSKWLSGHHPEAIEQLLQKFFESVSPRMWG